MSFLHPANFFLPESDSSQDVLERDEDGQEGDAEVPLLPLNVVPEVGRPLGVEEVLVEGGHLLRRDGFLVHVVRVLLVQQLGHKRFAGLKNESRNSFLIIC